jgi:rare lipoprotein A
MKNVILILFFLPGFFYPVFAQSSSGRHKKINAGTSPVKNIIKYGIASFYANKFNGRKTANGNIYNSAKYTAACNVLPLNTWIKVTNLRNDKSVIVFINDRLNAKNPRLVDLSKIAAQNLGYVGRGLAHVQVEVIRNFQLVQAKLP